MFSIFDGLSNFFSQIYNAIDSAFKFLITLIDSLVSLILEIPAILTYLINCVGLLPFTIVSFVLCALTIRLILFIVGR